MVLTGQGVTQRSQGGGKKRGDKGVGLVIT